MTPLVVEIRHTRSPTAAVVAVVAGSNSGSSSGSSISGSSDGGSQVIWMGDRKAEQIKFPKKSSSHIRIKRVELIYNKMKNRSMKRNE